MEKDPLKRSESFCFIRNSPLIELQYPRGFLRLLFVTGSFFVLGLAIEDIVLLKSHLSAQQ